MCAYFISVTAVSDQTIVKTHSRYNTFDCYVLRLDVSIIFKRGIFPIPLSQKEESETGREGT